MLKYDTYTVCPTYMNSWAQNKYCTHRAKINVDPQIYHLYKLDGQNNGNISEYSATQQTIFQNAPAAE